MDKLLKQYWPFIAIAGAALVASGGILKMSLSPSTSDQNTDAVDKTLNAQTKVKQAMTADIRLKAERLFGAMRGFGTDFNIVREVFSSLITKEQVQALYLAYGKRRKYDTAAWFGFQPLDMVTSLKDDLSASEWAIILPKLRLGGLA